MFKSNNKQISALVGGGVLIGMAGLLAYAAVLFSTSKQPIGYIGQPTMSNLNVSSNNEKIYRGEYESSTWSGTFGCYPVTNGGYVNLTAPCFGLAASSPLDVQAKAVTRRIGTRKDDASGTPIEFIYPSLSATQQLAMGATAAIATPNVDFIRGTSLAPAGLRARTTVLGDIIHSRPYYYTDGTNPTVFVGANDGMLHAFNATTGDERWAYVPSMLIPKLPALSSTGYAHDYYVDGSMSINKIAGGTKTLLIGALGAGGKGLYALDITNLTAGTGLAAGQKGMWEITNTTVTGTATRAASTVYKNLGDTYSNPALVPTQDGSDAVIVGNGYNNTGNGCAELFVIDAATGNKIAEINTNACSTTSPNGLSSPMVIDSNGDGKADRVYAGDIDGNMWLFDMLDPAPANWKASLLYATGKAITQRPTLALHPVKGYMLNFATGRILSDGTGGVIPPSTAAAADDTADTTINSAYGIWDDLSGTAAVTSSLISQTLTSRVFTPGNIAVRSFTTNNQPDWTKHRGWKVDFPIAGDRVTGDGSFIDQGKFHVNVTNPTVSYIPPGATAVSKGENWLYELDYLTGAAGTAPFLDMDNSGVVNDADRLKYTAGIDTLPAGATFGNPNTAASGIPVAYATSNGVQSQPILIQLTYARVPLYNQNFNQTAGVTPPPGQVGVGGGHYDVDMHCNTPGTANGKETSALTCTSVPVSTKQTYNVNHTHEYDKKYDTTGVNFLNPNLTNIQLKTAIPSAATPYKVLLMNQSYNRAAYLKVGDNVWSTKDYLTGKVNASGSYVAGVTNSWGQGYLDVATMPFYTGNSSTVTGFTKDAAGKVTITTVQTPGTIGGANGTLGGPRSKVGGLEMGMPWDAFKPKDWWKDGVTQSGLFSSDSGCARDGHYINGNGQIDPNKPPKYYALGTTTLGEARTARNDGAFTIQIIKANTPNAAVRMNVPGKPEFGFRVVEHCGATGEPVCAPGSTTSFPVSEYVYAEYAVYWHHPQGICNGDTTTQQTYAKVSKTKTGNVLDANGKPVVGWTLTPALDENPTTTKPTYSTVYDDPRDGSFNGSSGTVGQPGGGAGGGGGAAAGLVNLMGGRPAGAAAGTGAGGTPVASGVGSSGASASGVGTPSTMDQVGGLPVAKRTSWRELFGL